MAFGMRHWLAVVAVATALVAVRLLPPENVDLPVRRNPPTAAEERLDSLRDVAARTNMILQRVRWADSIIPATLNGTTPLVFSVPDNVDPRSADEVLQKALAEVVPSDVATGLFFLPWRLGSYPDAPKGGQRDAEYFFGERDGRVYCAVVRAVWSYYGTDRPPRLATPFDEDSYLGLCELIEAYGLPGAAVNGWLARGGTALAKTAGPTPDGVAYMFERFSRDFYRRGTFGSRPTFFGTQSMVTTIDACFAGVTASCAELFVDPVTDRYYGYTSNALARMVELSPVSAMGNSSFFRGADSHVAADLAQAFGEESFRRFWTAGGTVEDAFQDAFGVDIGTWNLRRISGYVSITPPGPRLSGLGALGMVLLLVLSGVIATGWARGRTVG